MKDHEDYESAAVPEQSRDALVREVFDTMAYHSFLTDKETLKRKDDAPLLTTPQLREWFAGEMESAWPRFKDAAEDYSDAQLRDMRREYQDKIEELKKTERPTMMDKLNDGGLCLGHGRGKQSERPKDRGPDPSPRPSPKVRDFDMDR